MVNLDYLYNPNDSTFNKDFFSNRKLSFETIKHGMILPHKDCRVNGVWTWGAGGIVDGAGKFVTRSFVRDGVGKVYTSPRINHSKFRDRNLSQHILSSMGACHNR